MDNKHNQNNLDQEISTSGTHISSDSDTSVASSLSQPPKPKQGVSKKTFVLTIIFTLLFTACVTSVIWYFVTTNNTNNNANFVNNCAELTEPEDTETDVTEVEITDIATKDELSKKIALLHFTDDVDNYSLKAGGYPVASYIQYFYENDNSDALKLYTAIMKDYRAQQYHGNVDADSVAITYEDLYGEAPTHQDITLDLCPHFTYDATNNQYIEQAACGGVWFNGYALVMTDFMSDDEGAYVDTKLVSTLGNPEENTCSVYAGIYSSDALTSDAPTPLYIIDDSSCDGASDFSGGESYRFSFKEAPDSSYYFDSVEKL